MLAASVKTLKAMFTTGNPGSVMGPAFVWGKIQFYNLTFGFIEIAGNKIKILVLRILVHIFSYFMDLSLWKRDSYYSLNHVETPSVWWPQFRLEMNDFVCCFGWKGFIICMELTQIRSWWQKKRKRKEKKNTLFPWFKHFHRRVSFYLKLSLRHSEYDKKGNTSKSLHHSAFCFCPFCLAP